VALERLLSISRIALLSSTMSLICAAFGALMTEDNANQEV